MHPGLQMPAPPPLTMRLSTGLLFGTAGLLLLNALVELVFTNTDLSVYKDAYTGDTGSAFGSLAWATFVLLIGAGVCILAILNSHGNEKSRVTTLVLGGLFMVCGGVGSLAGGFHNPTGSAGSGAAARVLPATYGLTVTILDGLVLLSTLIALVLLVLPPSTRFFHSRKKVEFTVTWVPAAPAPPPPPPFGGPAFGPPVVDQTPHSANIPMADPWSESEKPTDYHPRHHGESPV
ncbi:hypothetical protein AB0M54_14095 [Actinoplanes sp. NPDC051470]|uniref:hypothetical protein n=1 Tax=Actinoplanes sp. NPDC051470 TaxID=3157224 RepID=UPI0034368792